MLTPEIAAVLLDIIEHPIRSIAELLSIALCLSTIIALVIV